ncbi:MAG: tRNA (adenosine(37)-N6)-threonylcarbamoyltransferase complex transferase subunit TsaD [Desulfovibrio sp.]
MLCLGLETSCDETAVALCEDGRPVAEKLASQIDVHALFGGVVPELASREHLRRMGPLLRALFADSGLTLADVDAVAVARGPGLLGSLLIGLATAKGLALGAGKPLIGVDHLHAHLMAATIGREVPYPALGLLVSGGHTQIMLLRSALDIAVLGRTVDDAAGEAFDKAAKSLNLPYPGGIYIDVLGRDIEADHTLFPRPFLDNHHLDFSFSGLKTAVATYVAAHGELRLPVMPSPGGAIDPTVWPMPMRRVCAALNFAIADTLRVKMERALDSRDTGPVRALLAAGGVAANSRIRDMLTELAARRGLPLFLPRRELCADNATMIAATGCLLGRAGLTHGLDCDAVPRGRRVPWDYREGPPLGRASVDRRPAPQ